MTDPNAPYADLVWRDMNYRASVWRNKGVAIPVIARTMIRCGLGSIYLLQDHREWGYSADFAIERATFHKNWVDSVIRREVPLFPLPDLFPPSESA
jgi:hypothetical protein